MPDAFQQMSSAYKTITIKRLCTKQHGDCATAIPGNIRHNATRYLGEIAGTDKSFKTFSAMPWGYRAMFVALYTYQRRYGLNTITGLIRRWAPSNENDTEAYIAAVSRDSGIQPTTWINTQHRDTMIPIVAAMSRVENGVSADISEVEAGWELFEKHKP